MNEHIDTLLTASKITTRNNPWAHLATQAFSMGYNVQRKKALSVRGSVNSAPAVGYLSRCRRHISVDSRTRH